MERPMKQEYEFAFSSSDRSCEMHNLCSSGPDGSYGWVDALVDLFRSVWMPKPGSRTTYRPPARLRR